MVRLELVPSLQSCIETIALREYKHTMARLLNEERNINNLWERAEILKAFIESNDLGKLRSDSEKYLLEGRKVKFVIYLEEGQSKYDFRVD